MKQSEEWKTGCTYLTMPESDNKELAESGIWPALVNLASATRLASWTGEAICNTSIIPVYFLRIYYVYFPHNTQEIKEGFENFPRALIKAV